MPIYEYRCRNGHTFEAIQSMSDDPITACEECGVPVERVFHPVAVHFKGSGFYTTDYARKGSKAGAGEDSSKSDGGDSSGSKSESKTDSGSKSDSASKSTEKSSSESKSD